MTAFPGEPARQAQSSSVSAGTGAGGRMRPDDLETFGTGIPQRPFVQQLDLAASDKVRPAVWPSSRRCRVNPGYWVSGTSTRPDAASPRRCPPPCRGAGRRCGRGACFEPQPGEKTLFEKGRGQFHPVQRYLQAWRGDGTPRGPGARRREDRRHRDAGDVVVVEGHRQQRPAGSLNHRDIATIVAHLTDRSASAHQVRA